MEREVDKRWHWGHIPTEESKGRKEARKGNIQQEESHSFIVKMVS